ncbi:hypothetical protein D8Y22_11905 [Salinadaptatus halalkaliphilus]|uniref:Uncharacterized protein n=1 Tax=Salinadaptatus halalkaliphilus TaxID=2419781 RepID=A0A4S3TKF8_9EURY|nr:hypothetical protein [Salinadaptatus halalkaliphilus]THE64614.1 hypothetical protein D8Y22_11905 [Salinadaptatus halalkaliphilus]
MGGGLAVEPDEIYAIYLEIADEIFADEESLRNSLPIDATAGVSRHLSGVVDRWSDARKSLRTIPTANVYARELDDLPDQSILRILVGLDAEVNALDDIIDTEDLSTERRVALTANAAFASMLIAESVPTAHREAIATVLREYFTALFQIPLVEARLFEQVRNASTKTGQREATREIYAYRARDIDAFARIPALVFGLDEQTKQRIISDLRTYRAHRLLYKDIHDVSRDLADDDMTPVIALLTAYDSIETIMAKVEQIYDHFEYTATGETRYRDVLIELEEPPNDLAALLREQQELVRAAAD